MIQGLSVVEKLNLQRKIIGISTELTMDKQGRITLPANLIEFGQLEGCNEVVVIGIEHVIEIWNPEVFRINDETNEPMALEALNRRPTI
ncbi:MAG TPA: division/cell wall cluster transcriptional repressor MraZ [bacterium]|nr:division/cell wall cluster transcriptional repressor MraZ [bacterium]HPN41859.1 division/cell wall cluster transcriptional repressor MraZ [bacterium]